MSTRSPPGTLSLSRSAVPSGLSWGKLNSKRLSVGEGLSLSADDAATTSTEQLANNAFITGSGELNPKKRFNRKFERLKVKGEQLMYDEKEAQGLFRWQEKKAYKKTKRGNPGHAGGGSFLRLQRDDKGHATSSKSLTQHEANTRPIPSPAPDSNSSFFELVAQDDPAIEFVRHKNGRLQPKRATLPKLVELLAHEKGRDVKYETDFLYTYRDFTSPNTLAELLITRFKNLGPDSHPGTYLAVRKRVVLVFKRWSDIVFSDFEEAGGSLLNSVMEWIDGTSAEEETTREILSKLKTHLQKKANKEEQQRLLDEEAKKRRGGVNTPVPYLPINITSASLNLLDIHPEEVARQMTLVESEMFRKILPHEWLNQAWTRPDKAERAPGIMRMIYRFNNVSRWLATEIVTAQTVNHRVVLVNRFLIIAQKCLELQNFNAVMEILSGLESSPVQRLKQTWMNLPRKAWELFDELNELMSIPQNFKKFRALLSVFEPPCVPYIGVFLKDLIFIDQGGKETDSSIINFEKREMVAKILRQVAYFQPHPYNLVSVEFIQDFLSNMKPLEEDELYSKSLSREGIGTALEIKKKRHKSSLFPLRKEDNVNPDGG